MLLNYLSFGPNRNSLDAFHNHIGDKSDFNARKQINLFVKSSPHGQLWGGLSVGPPMCPYVK